MFKKCKKSVLSSNSIATGPANRVPVNIVRHSGSVSSVRNEIAQEGTNSMLSQGGMLPYVLPDDCVGSPRKISPDRHGRRKSLTKVTNSVQVRTDSKPATKLMQIHPTQSVKQRGKGTPQHERKVPVSCEEVSQSANLSKCEKETVLNERERLIINKENYLTFISHFNEEGHKDVYDPSDFSGKQEKQTAHSSKSSCQKVEDTSSTVNYDNKTKAEILQSIREELQTWRANN